VIFVTGLIEFGLTDDVSVHAFYHHFYLLLEVEKLVKCLFIVFTLIGVVSLLNNVFLIFNQICTQFETINLFLYILHKL